MTDRKHSIRGGRSVRPAVRGRRWEERVAQVPGSSLGTPGHARPGVAHDEEKEFFPLTFFQNPNLFLWIVITWAAPAPVRFGAGLGDHGAGLAFLLGESPACHADRSGFHGKS